MYRAFFSFIAFLSICLFSFQPASAAEFNIDFGDDFTGLSSAYGAASGQTGTWNDVFANGALTDTSGTLTTVTVTLVAGSTSGQFGSGVSNDERLLGDFFFSSGAGWNLDFANLTDGLYDVYYYAPSSTAVSTGAFTINGTPVAELPGDGSSALIQGTSYDVLSSVSVVGGTLSLASGGGVLETNFGLAGLQLVSVPEPATLSLLALGMAAALLKRKRGNA
jgi:hypothetical protein